MKQSKRVATLLIAAAMIGIGIWSTGSFARRGIFTPDQEKPKMGSPSPVTPKVAPMKAADTMKKAAPKTGNAQIKLNEDIHEFGKIEQNTFAETTFIISNTGTDTLEIFGAQPSCGCTAAVQGKKRIPPGDTSHLFIRFDPHNKAEGEVTKVITITSNAKDDAQKLIRIHGTIYKSKLAHKESMHLDGVFQGNCASCHVEKGKGELGAKLYEADCAICHGSKADNKPGPDIAADPMMNHTTKQWKEIIGEGLVNTNMPAFALKHKGPLNEEEIASLADYLGAYKKNLVREKELRGGANTPAKTTGSVKNHQ
jgi:hypothetical protein